MKMNEAFIAEMEMEARTTRKFLESFPADKMHYKPHEKSMPASQLAMHIATIPQTMAEWATPDTFDMAKVSHEQMEHTKDDITKEQILKAFEKSLETARALLSKMDDAKMTATWNFTMNGKTLMSMPRMAMIRSFMMNHLYHHRGQFGVYLRLMGARVPSSYGPSADENPMAEMMEAAARG